MNDLSRLLDSSEDELALSLLRSASEEPPPEAIGKVARALGVGGALALSSATTGALLASKAQVASAATLAPAAATAPSVSSLSWLVGIVAKPLAIGVVGGLCTLSGIKYVSQPRASEATTHSAELRSQPAQPARTVTSPREASPVAPAEVSESTAVVSITNPSEARLVRPAAAPRVALTPAPTPVAPEVRPLAAAAAFPSPVAAPSEPAPAAERARTPSEEALAKELGLLRQARGLLGAGDARGALRQLDQYVAERKSGALEPEATVLRIEALQRLGDRAGAAGLARGFLRAHPERGHDESLRSIAGQAP
ncbi:MAG: hypothetical protein QM756_45465 [Polyangiaceae bacterium]